MAAAKVPDLSYSCEICGADGMNDDEMRLHVMICHLKDAVLCPFCNLSNLGEEEMLAHVNNAHLDYLTPEQELMAFIDDGDELHSPTTLLDSSRWRLPSNKDQTSRRNELINNNNNNNIEYFDEQQQLEEKKQNGEISVWSSPQRSQLALNLRSSASVAAGPPKSNVQFVMFECPLCSFQVDNVAHLEEHINRQHFDLTSPSLNNESPVKPYNLYNCPLCVQTFENTPDLELHVNIEHKDILSPAKPIQDLTRDSHTNECPICCMTSFKSTDELAQHIDEHFNPKGNIAAGMSPLTPDVSCDRLLAKEMEKRDKEVQRLREQHEFELLRAQYGMDNEGNFKEQSLTNMQRAVYSGELSVADYYERQIELKVAESTGIDDGSSCTKDIVECVGAVSGSCGIVGRTLLCTTVDHYASTYGDRGWGCGYRNTQMMLSSLVHHTGYNEQLYKLWMLGRTNAAVELQQLPSRSAMPSISRLQQHIEWAWGQGFDTQGADQLGGQLVNTRKWIGATEVVTILSSLRIRCQLVDFHRPTSPNGSHPELFKWVNDYFQAYDDFKPPLYLQHQGHSRTIIGVEQLRDGGENLLILDPSHSPSQMAGLRTTATAPNVLRLIRKAPSAMKARQYQIVAVAGIMDSEAEYQSSKILRSVRVPPER